MPTKRKAIRRQTDHQRLEEFGAAINRLVAAAHDLAAMVKRPKQAGNQRKPRR